MFKNKFIKLLAAATFAAMGIFSTQSMVNNTVKADYIHNVGTFHYLNKKHTYKTLGYSEGFPYISKLDNGKYYTDSNDDDTTSQVDGIAKTNGYRYINGEKYYRIPLKHSNISVEYVAAKYFTKKYNDLSYEQIYTVTKAFSPRNGDMQASKTNLMLTKGANIEVDMYSKDDDIVSMSSPIDAKHGLKGLVDDGSYKDSFWLKMTQSQFRNNCRKAAPNAKFVFNEDGDYETNASLARGGIYHKGHFYKVYTR